MIKNIIIYLVLLIAAFVFNIFYYEWFSWIFFLIIASIPVFSLLISLPFMIITAKNGINVYSDEKIKINGAFIIYYTNNNNSAVPCLNLQIKLKAKNNLSNKEKLFKIKTSGTLCNVYKHCDKVLGKHSGAITAEIKSVRIYDLLGIFFIPLRYRKAIKTYVMPKSCEPENIPNFENITILGFKPKSGGGFSDYYELRPYKVGDSLKSVHWKLSSKSDELIIKEPSIPVTKEILLNPQLCESAECNDIVLGKLIFICDYFIENNIKCSVFLNNGSSIFKINNYEDIDKYLIALFNKAHLNEFTLSSGNSITIHIYADREEVSYL